MHEIPARCDSCGSLSRVPAMAVGKFAICPRCRAEFLVREPMLQSKPMLREIPTVYPVHTRTEPGTGLLYRPGDLSVPRAAGVAADESARVKPPVFTLGLPLAIALAAAGLSLGVAMVKDWSFGFRVKAIFVLLGLAWGLGATFYFLKAEWVEAIRKDLGHAGGAVAGVPAAGGAVQDPDAGPPAGKVEIEMVKGWTLEAFRFADKDERRSPSRSATARPTVAEQDRSSPRRRTARRPPPTARSSKRRTSCRCRGSWAASIVFKMADQATNRTVRVYRVGTQAVVLMAEGAFLPRDAREVKRFFDSLYFTRSADAAADPIAADGQQWDCQGCGDCCRTYAVRTTLEEKKRIEAQDWSDVPEIAASTRTVWEKRIKDFRLNHRDDGACVFLGPDNRCRMHAKYGAASKPAACRIYPFTLTPAGDTGASASASPARAHGRQRPPATSTSQELATYAGLMEADNRDSAVADAAAAEGADAAVGRPAAAERETGGARRRSTSKPMETKLRECLALSALCRRASSKTSPASGSASSWTS